MLFQIRDYILQGKFVSNEQLAREFRLDYSALSPMLELLVRKGAIKKHQEQTTCQSKCRKCHTACLDYYTTP